MKILVSYHYTRQNPAMWDELIHHLTTYGDFDLLLDSGAFSAHNSGKEVTASEYHRYLRTRKDRLWGYIQLDKIRDKDETLRNLSVAHDAGLRPIPVLTTDMAVSEASNLGRHHERLCVAGGTIWPEKAYTARLEQAWRESGCRLHGLGYTRSTSVWRTRCSTIDSSTWQQARQNAIRGMARMDAPDRHAIPHQPRRALDRQRGLFRADAGLSGGVVEICRFCASARGRLFLCHQLAA